MVHITGIARNHLWSEEKLNTQDFNRHLMAITTKGCQRSSRLHTYPRLPPFKIIFRTPNEVNDNLDNSFYQVARKSKYTYQIQRLEIVFEGACERAAECYTAQCVHVINTTSDIHRRHITEYAVTAFG